MSGSRTNPSDLNKTTCASSRNNDENAPKSTTQVAAEIYRKMPACIKEHIMNFALSGDKDCSCGVLNEESEKYKQAMDELFSLPPCVQTHILYMAFQEATNKGCRKNPPPPRIFSESSKKGSTTIAQNSGRPSSETTSPPTCQANTFNPKLPINSKSKVGSTGPVHTHKHPSSSIHRPGSSPVPVEYLKNVPDKQPSSNARRECSSSSPGVEYPKKFPERQPSSNSHRLAERQPATNSQKPGSSTSPPHIDPSNKLIGQKPNAGSGGRSSSRVEELNVILEIITMEKHKSAQNNKIRHLGPCSPGICEGGFHPKLTSTPIQRPTSHAPSQKDGVPTSTSIQRSTSHAPSKKDTVPTSTPTQRLTSHTPSKKETVPTSAPIQQSTPHTPSKKENTITTIMEPKQDNSVRNTTSQKSKSDPNQPLDETLKKPLNTTPNKLDPVPLDINDPSANVTKVSSSTPKKNISGIGKQKPSSQGKPGDCDETTCKEITGYTKSINSAAKRPPTTTEQSGLEPTSKSSAAKKSSSVTEEPNNSATKRPPSITQEKNNSATKRPSTITKDQSKYATKRPSVIAEEQNYGPGCDPSSCEITTNKKKSAISFNLEESPSNPTKVYPEAFCDGCDKSTCEETMNYMKSKRAVKNKKKRSILGSKESNICEPDSCDNRDAEVFLINKIMCGEVEDIDPQEVKKLVERENEDCDIFLSPTPPYIALNPGSFLPKKKLQNMHGGVPSSYPQIFPSADGAQYEPTPEMYVQVMQLIEANCDPVIAPNVHFNTLFNSSVVGDPVHISPVAKGYFQDVMVPIKEPTGIQYELVNKDVMQISKQLLKETKVNPDDSPKDNLFHEKNPDFEASFETLDTPFDISQEPPWKDIDLGPSVKAVGAQPLSVICVTDVKDLEDDALKTELQKGVDYYIETRAPLYTSHVQLRGTEPPKAFPGYGFVVPYANVTQVARSPSVVFKKAWQSVNPNNFKPESIIRLNNKSFV